MEDEGDNKPDAKEGPQLVHVQVLVYFSIFSRFKWTKVKIHEMQLMYCWQYFTWWWSIPAFVEEYPSIHAPP